MERAAQCLMRFALVMVSLVEWYAVCLPEMVAFEAGTFRMGLSRRERHSNANGESPARYETLRRSFRLAKYPVTNGEFELFMKENPMHKTGAFSKGYSYTMFSSVADGERVISAYELPCEPWWRAVHRLEWDSKRQVTANWTYLPVVHVDRDDALAYCKWAHADYRLPTEYEWEYAVRGGSNDSALYPWGQGFRRHRLNSWQGVFPTINDASDGYANRSPVAAFPPQTREGLHDMLGNVWEWTASSLVGPNVGERLKNCTRSSHKDNPSHHQKPIMNLQDLYVITKGGSYQDSIDGSGTGSAIRNSARLARPSTFTADNIGFRCAASNEQVKNKEPPTVYRKDVYKVEL